MDTNKKPRTRSGDVPDWTPPEEQIAIDPPHVERETMVGARVVWQQPIRGKVLVELDGRYGLVNADQLTGQYITLVNAAKLETPQSWPGILNLDVLAWRAGLVTREDTLDPERMKEFYRLVLAEAGKLIQKDNT